MPSKDDRYTIDQSPLYRLATKKKLAQLLHTSVRSMLSIVKRGDKNYNVFEISQRGKNRTVEHPKTYLEKIHKRLFKILRRIKTPEYLHSGIRGRSYISNAKAHRGNHPVAKIDIKGFYPSTTGVLEILCHFRNIQETRNDTCLRSSILIKPWRHCVMART